MLKVLCSAVLGLLLAGPVGAQSLGGARDSSGNKVPPTELYCRSPDGRAAPCGTGAPLVVTSMPGWDAAGGLNVFRVLSTGGISPMVVKSTGGRLYNYNLCNTGPSSRFVRYYNTPTPVIGTTPVYAGPIVVAAGSCQQFATNLGLGFSTGISMVITAGMGDSDTTPTTIGDVTGFLGFE